MKKLMIFMLGLFSFAMIEAQTQTSCCSTKKDCKPKTCCPSQSSTCCASASANNGEKGKDLQAANVVAKKEDIVE